MTLNVTLVKTADGSNTFFNPEIGEHYHSRHGALQESKHVFLNSGLQYFLAYKNPNAVSILEVGLGTGLNFLLSADFCTDRKIHLNYTGIEAYPLDRNLLSQTGYSEYIRVDLWESFLNKFSSSLGYAVEITACCKLKTANCKLMDFQSEQGVDVIYFDAFASIHQPEMWSDEALAHICQFLKPDGVFVTYAITGNLKRSMKNLGFLIEKAPGALGKREMLRAVRPVGA